MNTITLPIYRRNGEKILTMVSDNKKKLLEDYVLLLSSLNYVICYKRGSKPRKIFSLAGLLKQCPKGMRTHHKDQNLLNNTDDNLVVLTPKQHGQIHHDLRNMLYS